MVGSEANMTTLLRQAQVAQEWLIKNYLGCWLELIGGTIECDYPLARAHRVQLRSLANLVDHVDPLSPQTDQFMRLHSVSTMLQSTLRSMGGAPRERDLQWGIWARDVPTAIAYALEESEFMDPLICEHIAPCCMFAAFLVSRVVTDDGVADEISGKMFEEKPRLLMQLLRELPTAPEA